MGKAEYKVKGGKLIRVQLLRGSDKIERIKISGDFFLHPEEFIEELEKALLGNTLNESNLAEVIETVLGRGEATLLGAASTDFAKCIMMASEKDA